jgi:sulfite reductase beta subunit-like hemoprotein
LPQGAARGVSPAADWELVLKRNPVERLKLEKDPLGIREELPALIAAGYERVAEEEIVRLQWWGLYHDKPKVGTFMLRIKLPGGALTAARLRAIGEVANRYGRGDGELSTRQNVQLHWLALAELPEVFADLDRAGITTVGGCGDTVRNITGCPLQGRAHDELFDCSDVVAEAAAFFYGNPEFANLPRKHKYSISACADRCNAPEINCVALVGALRDGREGFGVLVGGGLSSVPRLARELGVFVPKQEAVEVLAAVTSVWAADLTYRVSRVKARLKFMVDDVGPEELRRRVEERLGRTLEDFTLEPAPGRPNNHLGVRAQGRPGLCSVGVPVRLGLISGEQMIKLAELAERAGAEIRVTRQQNLVLVDVREADAAAVTGELAAIGFPVDDNPVWGEAIACTGEPHCNFSVTETKSRLQRLVEGLTERFGEQLAGLRLHLDGCPHACAQHWIGDLGFQGTTARDTDGLRRQAYDIFLRGGLGAQAAIGRPLFRRVPSEQLDEAVAGLVAGWLEQRHGAESFADFSRRLADEQLGLLAGLEPTQARVRTEVAAA